MVDCGHFWRTTLLNKACKVPSAKASAKWPWSKEAHRLATWPHIKDPWSRVLIGQSLWTRTQKWGNCAQRELLLNKHKENCFLIFMNHKPASCKHSTDSELWCCDSSVVWASETKSVNAIQWLNPTLFKLCTMIMIWRQVACFPHAVWNSLLCQIRSSNTLTPLKSHLFKISYWVCVWVSVCVCVRACVRACTCAHINLFWLCFILCFVMGYVLQFGDMGHTRIHYYYISSWMTSKESQRN